MGAGKTSVGKALAGLLTCQFLDLDEYIQARAGRSIRDIFCESGEAVFRRLESAAIEEVTNSPMRASPLVLAVGGGAFAQPANVQMLRSAAASVVFLDAPVQVLMERCRCQGIDRPLFHDENQFRQLYEQRRSAYMVADACINTEGKTIAQVASEVAASLSLQAGGTVVHEAPHED